MWADTIYYHSLLFSSMLFIMTAYFLSTVVQEYATLASTNSWKTQLYFSYVVLITRVLLN